MEVFIFNDESMIALFSNITMMNEIKVFVEPHQMPNCYINNRKLDYF